MKRFIFWFGMACLLIAWLMLMRLTLIHEERPVPPRTPRPSVVIHKVADGPGRRVYRVERNGQSIVYIDDRGTRVRGNLDVIVDTDDEPSASRPTTTTSITTAASRPRICPCRSFPARE